MSNPIYFSRFLVTNQVFYISKHSYALVNLKPITPGHILIVPLRTSVVNLADLTTEENADYFKTLQLVHRFIKHHYKADSLNIAVQDGPEAGQTVPHLHTHVIPRYRIHNIGDKIYELLDDWRIDDWPNRRLEYMQLGGRDGLKKLAKPDEQRVERTSESMSKEAQELAESLRKFMEANSEF
ncbi:LAMI_0H03444g1_1 [Lachancea mirantina]|uniref:Bis(5'-adenosyl)-triphosphatase n=1 Tax=Lachancea mirantina TaxID=1230905 RepID=A0A1G4KEF4_9SACH|nr:LAMI_0H03444g1_1 [Lachancea mirantina]